MKEQSIYMQIFNDIKDKIASGTLKAGDNLPSEAELCKLYNTTRSISKRSLDLLADQGYIVKQRGKVSFVRGDLPSDLRKTIGLIITDFSDAFGTKLIYSIEKHCADLGYQFVLKRIGDQSNGEDEAIDSLSNAAGILLMPLHGEFYNLKILQLIFNKRALVFMDRKMRGLAAPTVSSDNFAAGEEGLEYLLNLGHRNIAFFSGPINFNSSVEQRLLGFIQGFAKNGVNHNPAFICQDLSIIRNWPHYSTESFFSDVKVAAKHLTKHPEISAAFASDYYMALTVKAAVESLNRRIPEEFSIITVDYPHVLTGNPYFTHLQQNEYVIGKEAVTSLHRIITQSDPSPAEDILIPMKLITGDSTMSRADSHQSAAKHPLPAYKVRDKER